jgi:hypothetical protein
MDMISLIYVSSETRPFSERDLVELLDGCNRKNRLLEVTGMLLYKDGNFMQILEGPEDAVLALYSQIEIDPRHRGAVKLLEETITKREFKEWSMGFRNLNLWKDAPEGFSQFMQPLAGGSFVRDPSKAREMLLKFRGNL